MNLKGFLNLSTHIIFLPPQSYQYLKKHSLKKLEQHIEKVDVSKKMHEIYYDKEKTRPVTNYKVDADGYAIIRTGIWYVYGKTKVRARDFSWVEAYGNAEVEAYADSLVTAHDNSKVRCYEEAMVNATDHATVWIYGNKNVHTYGNLRLMAPSNAKIIDKRENI
jgi:hypothetical protein